jgi:4-amino-4-deoxy-L-arabinose transferase-like glycosyltransferase
LSENRATRHPPNVIPLAHICVPPSGGKTGDYRCHYILIALCLLLAFGLRLYRLQANSLWEDEIMTASQAARPVQEMLHWTAGDIHPPGYYLLVGQSARLFNWADQSPSATTDWLWRLPSVLAGMLAVAVTYRLGMDWLGRRVGLAGAFLLAVSPVAIRYSQEARMHELFLLMAALSTWALTRALGVGVGHASSMTTCNVTSDRHAESMTCETRRVWWLVYALATAASLYTVYLAFAVILVQACWVLIRIVLQRARTGRQLLYWAASVAFALALYAPWWPVVLEIISQRIALQRVMADSAQASPLAFAVKAIYSLAPGDDWAAWLWLALWAVGVVSLVRKRVDLAVLGALWLLLPLALSVISQDPRARHMRNAFLLPAYLLFVVHGVEAIAQRLRSITSRESGVGSQETGVRHAKQAAACTAAPTPYSLLPTPYSLLLAGLFLVSVLDLPTYYQQAKPDWRDVGAYLEARTVPGDVIVADPLFDARRYLDYYYSGPAELATPAVLVASLPRRSTAMRESGGRVWAVTRFRPRPVAAMQPVEFPGLVISEPVVPVYEPDVLTEAMIDLMQQAVTAAPDWAARMAGEGIMEPDARVAQAAAYLFLGDVLQAAGRLPEAITAYEAMIADDPTPAAGYVTLAEAYQAAGRMQDAARAYQQAVVREPKWQGFPAEAAAGLVAAGKWAEAVAAYQAIIHPDQRGSD